jgi:pimeloyl-ACP methyl ester carboxylesterase
MEQVYSTDGTPIAYARSGTGPPLLLVHGITGDHRRWAAVLPALEAHFTVYAMDRRGRGQSGDVAAYSLAAEADDIVAVIAAIGTPTALLGYSSGAICALEAATRTDRMRRLVLFEPPIAIPPGQPMTPPAVLDRMGAQVAAGDHEGATLTFLREAVRLPEPAITRARQDPSWSIRIATAPRTEREMRAVEGYHFAPERFAALAVPTLLLMGGETAPHQRAAIDALAATLPDNQVRVLEGHGHTAPDSAPDLFAREVVRFLTGAE